MNASRIRMILGALVVLVPQTVLSAYVFTAPPREDAEHGYQVYKPIADFLTKETGQQFVYRQQNDWDEYVKDMRAEKYDLVFDGPHFVDWRIHNIKHRAILKIPHLLQWRVIVSKNEKNITKVEDLVGQKVCAPGVPNFGTLNLLSHFKDDSKQPQHVEVKGWNHVFEGVKNGECVAGVLPKKNHEIYDKANVYTKSIHTHLPYPNQAFTASSRIPDALREKIRKALLSDDGQKALENLRTRYTGGSKMVTADDEEYDSIHSLLLKAKNFAGYNQPEEIQDKKGSINHLVAN